MTDKTDDFFKGEATEVAELARVAIGDGAKGTLAKLEGFYRYTVQEWDEENSRPRYLHAIELAKAVGQNTAYLVWGNHTIDKHLPVLPVGTKVRLEYKGMQELDGGRRMKIIDVMVPKGTKRVPNPFVTRDAAASEAAAF
jgi:hypothetical protein